MTEQDQVKKQKTVDQPPRPQNIGIKGIEIYIPSQVC
ncbi:protein ERG13 [Kluyveromyces marxianus]|uniref:Protein ERG13 n=1 Tax=Kluyveromyces marxianus TaxID=4911 RepID=A0ABX6EZD8_KLUMA|nr:protein ERG13 [Kluyveromyces marxianus]